MTRSRDGDTFRLMIGILGVAVLIVGTMITAVFLVSRRPVVIVVPGGGSPSNVASPAPAAAAAPTAAAEALPGISVAKVAAAPAIDNPLDPAWEKFAAVELDLTPQQVKPPVLETGTIAKLRVQAVRDEARYVWRMSWDKAEKADQSDVGRFSDAVAVQFPMVDGAPYTMGGPGLPVRMLYWKALWQADVDQGFQGLTAMHPNADVDLYWFAEGEEAHAATGSIDNPRARQWMIAAQSGNPMADDQRKNPVEELTAHGFGSGTHVGDTPSRGRGVWSEGRWFVVIDRPIRPDDPLIKRFVDNPDKQLIAFAVWDGAAGNRGGKKHITNWLPMRIAP